MNANKRLVKKVISFVMNFGFSQTNTSVMSSHPTSVMMQAQLSSSASNQNENSGITMELLEDELWKKFHEIIASNLCKQNTKYEFTLFKNYSKCRI